MVSASNFASIRSRRERKSVLIDCEDNYRADRPALGHKRFREVWKPQRASASAARSAGVIGRAEKIVGHGARKLLLRHRDSIAAEVESLRDRRPIQLS